MNKHYEELAFYEKLRDMLEDGKFVKDGNWDREEIKQLNEHMFLTSKPMVYLVNVG